MPACESGEINYYNQVLSNHKMTQEKKLNCFGVLFVSSITCSLLYALASLNTTSANLINATTALSVYF